MNQPDKTVNTLNQYSITMKRGVRMGQGYALINGFIVNVDCEKKEKKNPSEEWRKIETNRIATAGVNPGIFFLISKHKLFSFSFHLDQIPSTIFQLTISIRPYSHETF